VSPYVPEAPVSAAAAGVGGATTSDVLVVGGGIVGASIAYGMARSGAKVRVLDGGDGDIRAARANFGLVWVQSKGHDMPAYARWTRDSADLWPQLAGDLVADGGPPLHLRQTGGLSYCLDEAGFEERRLTLARLHNQQHAWGADVSLLDRAELERMLPALRLGNRVTGASFCVRDGDCDPLALLRALHAGLGRHGGMLHPGVTAHAVTGLGSGFRVETDRGVFEAGRLVLAAGLGSKPLAEQLGIPAPIRPERGQILVTERLRPFLHFTGDTIRQTVDGTVMIGATHEAVGLDLGTTMQAGATLAAHAAAVFPDLAHARLVRTWAGLRVLTPDGCPLYATSPEHPGAVLVTCHSGVTLAAAHALRLAPMLLAEVLDAGMQAFGAQRFGQAGDVPQAA
jgi:glycine/D-amino acid oxidase-like deaminating enzyme